MWKKVVAGIIVTVIGGIVVGIALKYIDRVFFPPDASSPQAATIAMPPLPVKPVVPSPTETAVASSPSPIHRDAKTAPNFSPKFPHKVEFVGPTSSFDTTTGRNLDPENRRMWRISVTTDGFIERAYIYYPDRLVFELVISGSYQTNGMFVGNTKQVWGAASYTPDDIVLTFSPDLKSLKLSWNDPIRQRHGFGTLTECKDTSSLEAILTCSGSSFFDMLFGARAQ